MFEQPTAIAESRHRAFFAREGDTRQVWARRVAAGPGDPPFFLKHGSVDDSIRQQCRDEELLCPLAGCPDPRLIARGGHERRHHFAHRVAHLAHDSAAVRRENTRAALTDWLTTRYGSGFEIATVDEENDPVIRVTSIRTGKSIELAVTWRRQWRHAEVHLEQPYRQLLVGHSKALLLPRGNVADDPMRWWCGESTVAAEILLRRPFAHALNPQDRLIGTLVPVAYAARCGLLAPSQRWAGFEHVLFVAPLAEAGVSAEGVVTPHSERVAISAHADDEPRVTSGDGSSTSAACGALAARSANDPVRDEYLRRVGGVTEHDERMRILREVSFGSRQGE